MRYTFLRLMAVVALIGALSIMAFGQADATSATVKGTVTDQQGAAVAGAKVTAKNIEQGTTRSDTTSADGEFQLLALRPGLYEITVQAQGFANYLVKDAQLTVGQVATYAIKLDVGKVTNEVTVTSSAPLIEVERTQQSNTIETKQIQNLPNIGRSFDSYVYTLPGVASSTAPRVQGGGRFTFGTSGFSIGGSNGRGNLTTVDGGENEYGSGQLRFALSPEAVQEFQVNRNSFNAEFGFTAGTALNVVTRSGSNEFHGSAYTYFRSDKTSAKERFIPAFISPSTRVYQQQFYPGFTFGGPVVKNKLFFFTNYERQKLDIARFRSYSSNILTQPSGLQTALLNRLDTSTDPVVRGVVAQLRPTLSTNATSNTTGYNLLRQNEGIINAPFRLNSWISRVDYNIGQNDTIMGRFSLSRNFSEQLGTEPAQAPSNATTLTVRDYTSLIGWTHNFGSSVVNQLRVQFSPKNSAFTTPRPPGSTALILTGIAAFNRNSVAPFNTLQDRYQFEDNLTWIHGNHNFKFGGSFRPVNYEVRNDLWVGGEWNFQGGVYPITALLGSLPAAAQGAVVSAICTTANRPAGDCTTAPTAAATVATLTAGTALNALQSFNFGLPFLYRQSFGNSTWKDTVRFLGFFAQDSWKVNNRLSLDYGLRFDYDGEPRPLQSAKYVSPRFGFAYDLTGDKKTVVRGGGGIFYSPVYYQVPYLVNLLNDTGEYLSQVFRSPAFPAAQTPAALWARGVAAGKLPFKQLDAADLLAAGVSTAPKGTGRVVIEVGPDYKANYSVQANFGIQRQIVSDLSVELAYNMYRGIHIQMPVPVNLCEAGAPGCTPTAANAAALATRNPAFGPLYQSIDPTITQKFQYTSRGNSIYHGMTMSLTKRFSNHFSFQSSYTWSKTIDDVTDFNTAFSAPFATRLFLERALSSFDLRHNYVFSGVFTSPWKNAALRDFSIAPIISVRSGIPFTLSTGQDINADTRATNDRLFYIGRNTGIGPSFRSVDARLTRTFRFSSDGPARLDFTVEVINLLNKTNYAAVRDIIPPTVDATGKFTEPDYNAGTVRLTGRTDRSIALGQPLAFSSAFEPRRFQFGLKLVF
ncbi:MAG: carboxypeptidase regulatory-like domain-containing protein [Blastocatellia bacterium]